MSQSLDSRAWSQRNERVLKGAEGVGQGGSGDEGQGDFSWSLQEEGRCSAELEKQ